MASIVLSELERVAVRVLVALGASVVGGKAVEQTVDAVKKHNAEADEAKSTPIARTETLAKTKEKCKKCPPDMGAATLQSTAGWSEVSIMYQMRIARMPPAPVGFLCEWIFNGVQFDGFDSEQCLLKEAKGRYDQFFDDFGAIEDWWRKGEAKMFNEAMRQGAAAQPRPPTRLRWHFMQPISYRYFSRIIQAAYPDVEVVFQP